MLRLLTTAALVGVASASLTVHVNDPAHLAEVAANARTWTSGPNARFNNKTLGDVKTMCGTVMKDDPNPISPYYELPRKATTEAVDAIPSDFDSRTGFPQCAATIGHIRDQSSCGSCWAFGSTEAYNDRRCIKTNDTTLLSPDDTVACCGFLQCLSMGCGGGQPSAAWRWFTRTGVVTGGDFGDKATCQPYTLAPCAHHVNSTKYPACPSSEYPTPKCTKKCAVAGYKKAYSDDKSKASKSYSLSGVAAIQADIMTKGPVTGAFTVYADFPTYKSGVYKHTSGAQLGGHAIKILGWGVEGGEDYWLVANSWNEQWGDQGYFKIARGTNECGIEGQISAGDA